MKVSKVIRTVNISSRVNDEIVKRIHAGFNFSGYVEKCFIKDFLSEEELIKEREEHLNRLKEIDIELKVLSVNDFKFFKGVTDEEKRFIKDVIIKVSNGYDIKAFNKVFNKNFKRDLSLYDFKELIRLYSKELKK